MPGSFKKTFIAIVTFLGGLYFALAFFLPEELSLLGTTVNLGDYNTVITDCLKLIGAMAIGLGLINIFRAHGNRILKASKGATYSGVLLLGLIVVLAIEFISLYNEEKARLELLSISSLTSYIDKVVVDDRPLEARKNALKLGTTHLTKAKEKIKNKQARIPSKSEITSCLDSSIKQFERLEKAYDGLMSEDFSKITDETKSAIESCAITIRTITQEHDKLSTAGLASTFVEKAIFIPLGASTFALLAFYVASAAYRSFRIKNVESTLMMLVALLVILGQIPHGPLYIWEDLPYVRRLLMTHLNTPGNRAIFFGSAVAGLAMAIRIWLSLERNPLDEEQQ